VTSRWKASAWTLVGVRVTPDRETTSGWLWPARGVAALSARERGRARRPSPSTTEVDDDRRRGAPRLHPTRHEPPKNSALCQGCFPFIRDRELRYDSRRAALHRMPRLAASVREPPPRKGPPAPGKVRRPPAPTLPEGGTGPLAAKLPSTTDDRFHGSRASSEEDAGRPERRRRPSCSSRASPSNPLTSAPRDLRALRRFATHTPTPCVFRCLPLPKTGSTRRLHGSR